MSRACDTDLQAVADEQLFAPLGIVAGSWTPDWESYRLDSVTIVRGRAIVADLYLNPLFPRDTPHMNHLCTQNIVSVGIAIGAGHVDGVHVPVLDLLADNAPPHVDPRLSTLTVEHLLTMQTGLRSRDSFL